MCLQQYLVFLSLWNLHDNIFTIKDDINWFSEKNAYHCKGARRRILHLVFKTFRILDLPLRLVDTQNINHTHVSIQKSIHRIYRINAPHSETVEDISRKVLAPSMVS